MSVTRDVLAHPRDLSRHYTEKFGISRVTATKHIRRLETEGWIARSGTSTHPVFSAGFNRRIDQVYALAGLEEHDVWARDFAPFFLLSPNVNAIANHGFTEMVNNAVDHSEGARLWIRMSQTENLLTILVSDDGVGSFRKISDALELPDMRQALFELSKASSPQTRPGIPVKASSSLRGHSMFLQWRPTNFILNMPPATRMPW